MTADGHTLAGAYAVDAVPPADRLFFERHIAVCGPCRQEVMELTATAATLGAAMAEAPSASLRARVLGEVERTRQVPPQVTTGRAGGWQHLQLLLAPVAAAMLVIVLVLGGVTAALLNRIAGLQQQAVASEELVAVLADSRLRVVDVDARRGTVVRLLHTAAEQRVVLVIDGLRPAPAQHTYQLWVLRDGAPVANRLFAPDQRARALIALEYAKTGADGVAVTVEPRGGSLRPSGETVVREALDV